MNNTKILLLDFDRTLTRFHTTGALCFSNENFNTHLNPNSIFQDKWVFSENSCSNPKFLIETLQSLLNKGVCIAIVTMADEQHGLERAKQLKTEEMKQTHHVLAGKNLVIRWLFCIALKAYDDREEVAKQKIDNLLESKLFCIVAKFTERSKQQHFAEALRIFESRSLLNPHDVKPEEIVYADDSPELLLDMQNALPGIHTILIVNGLTETKWQNIIEKF